MTTIELQAPPADGDLNAAVQAQMGKIVTELRNALVCCSPPPAPGAGDGRRSPEPAH